MKTLKEATPETAYGVAQQAFKDLDEALNPKPRTPEEIAQMEKDLHAFLKKQGWKFGEEGDSPK